MSGSHVPSVAKELSRKPRRGDPLVRAVVPSAPPHARWEVLEWNKAMCNWQHFAYETTKERCQKAASELRALGGKAKFRKLVKGMPSVVGSEVCESDGGREHHPEPSTSSRAKVQQHLVTRVGGGKPQPKKAVTSRSTSEPTSAAYRKAVLRSLLHWIDIAERAELEFHLPHAEVKSLRDRLQKILLPRLSRLSLDVRSDPLLKWQA